MTNLNRIYSYYLKLYDYTVNMKKLVILCSILLSTVAGFGQLLEGYSSNTKIYIVRHAEKYTGKDAGRDPLLIATGMQRSGDLMRYLLDKKIKHIYVTPYKRSWMTADSMRIQLGIDTVHYKADTLCDDLVKKITEKNDLGNSILIIGHSNTLPKIIRRLGIIDYPQTDIPDNEHDNIFLVRKKGKKLVVKHYKYGQSSAADPASPMKN